MAYGATNIVGLFPPEFVTLMQWEWTWSRLLVHHIFDANKPLTRSNRLWLRCKLDTIKLIVHPYCICHRCFAYCRQLPWMRFDGGQSLALWNLGLFSGQRLEMRVWRLKQTECPACGWLLPWWRTHESSWTIALRSKPTQTTKDVEASQMRIRKSNGNMVCQGDKESKPVETKGTAGTGMRESQ